MEVRTKTLGVCWGDFGNFADPAAVRILVYRDTKDVEIHRPTEFAVTSEFWATPRVHLDMASYGAALDTIDTADS